jgi:hypothetical protein
LYKGIVAIASVVNAASTAFESHRTNFLLLRFDKKLLMQIEVMHISSLSIRIAIQMRFQRGDVVSRCVTVNETRKQLVEI